jgi:ribosomal protein S18 acetylase RimI-like enzyme
MEYKVVAMNLNRFDELINFWKSIEGLYLSDDDSYENLSVFLKRNPKLNFVVLRGDSIIATIKCSHDGRRGYIHHLAVKEGFRKKGIARELVARCLNNLREKGIKEYRVFVVDSNQEAIRFWKHIGFEEQVYDYRTLQMNATVFNELVNTGGA